MAILSLYNKGGLVLFRKKIQKTSIMYNKKLNKGPKTSIRINAGYEGESIEEKVRRIMANKEPIEDATQPLFTDRKDGVIPMYDIRHDKWETMTEATDALTKSKLAKGEEKAKLKPVEGGKSEEKKDGGPESTQATDGTGGSK